MEALKTSELDLSGGFQLGSQIFAQEGLGLHNAKTSEGVDVVVLMLDAEPPPDRAAAFQAALKSHGVGGLLFQRLDNQVAVAQASVAGLISHVPALQWRLKDRLKLFRQVALVVDKFHASGQTAGPLDPDRILLDNRFQPLLLGAGFGRAEGVYAARDEIKDRFTAKQADILSLGRLLHYLLMQKDPPPLRKDLRLRELMAYPAGLSRIVRKAIQPAPQDRYLSVDDFIRDVDRYGRYDEVGVPHDQAQEINLGGLSFGPAAPMPDAILGKETVMEQIAAGNLSEIQPFSLRQDVRSLLVVLGVVSVIIAFGINYLAGDPMWIRVALSIAAGLVGFALMSPGIPRESSTRTVFALCFGLATFVLNPTSYVAHFAETMGLQSSLATKRQQSFQKQAYRGRTKFHGSNLAGANLKGQMFPLANLEGASFEDADLSEAKFLDARLDGAYFKGAKLYGTWLHSSSLLQPVDLELAHCDGKTLFPGDWECAGGHPFSRSQSFAPRSPSPVVRGAPDPSRRAAAESPTDVPDARDAVPEAELPNDPAPLTTETPPVEGTP